MKRNIVSFHSIYENGRIDAKYYTTPGFFAASKIKKAKRKGVPFKKLGGEDGIANVLNLSRFKCAYAADEEDGIPYLRPYDVFEYLPKENYRLSLNRTKLINNYTLKRGQILQTCSGRNLGPLTLVDNFLSKFVIGSDMLRIEVNNEDWRYYLYGYLNSSVGQNLLKWGKTGSVIDHLSRQHLMDQDVPILDISTRNKIIKLIRDAFLLKEEARTTINDLLLNYEKKLPPIVRSSPLQSGWTFRAKNISDRLDAAFYDPIVSEIRNNLKSIGGQRLSDKANVLKPKGRYKTYYVDKEYGKPIMSGTQILQEKPINLRYIAPRAFQNIKPYKLAKGWIVYQADGRVERGLGTPAMVTADKEGWLASGHVGRVISKSEKDNGWLFLALRTEHCLVQIKSKASGSVVDSTFTEDMEDIILPPKLNVESEIITESWNKFSIAQEKENEAVRLFEKFFETI